jgi:hypothetical protein
MSDVRSSAGSTISIGAAQPATYTEAGYEALTLTPIGEVTDLGEFGRVYELITHNSLASRGTQKFKGSFNEGSVTIQLASVSGDAGQALAKTARDSDSDYSFVITTQNGDQYFFQAKVMSFATTVGSTGSLTTASIMLELTTTPEGVGIVEVVAV